MSDRETNVDRVFDLAAAICDASASPGDCVELDSIVVADEASRRDYWDYCWIHVALRMEARVHRALQKVRERDNLDPTALTPWESDALAVSASPSVASVALAPSFPATLFHSTINHLSTGWPAAYLIATVICGIGLVIGAFTYVSQPALVVQGSAPAANNRAAPAPNVKLVGRITGILDCRFAVDSKTKDRRPKTAVSLGDKFALLSGLLEITYDTGARVILQGPVTYEVESSAGGFLSVGKLTARVDGKSEIRNPKSQTITKSPNPSLSTLHSPLFTVRTPTATVTDLGTEFAVEVQPEGFVEVQVFEGHVETTRQARSGATPLKQRLAAGEAIRFVSATASAERIPVRPSPSVADLLHAIPKARSARLLPPVGVVATAYHRVWGVGGVLAAENDRRQAFQVVTDGIFGRGENGQGPRSSFDTLAANRAKSDFVGLLYDRPMRFDRIKVFLGRQCDDGGSWQELPRLFILNRCIDPGSTPPEDDPANWRAVPLCLSYGSSFSAKANANPGEVLEFVLTIPAEDRIGYGWAVGGVKGNGTTGCVSITELRAYGEEVSHGN